MAVSKTELSSFVKGCNYSTFERKALATDEDKESWFSNQVKELNAYYKEKEIPKTAILYKIVQTGNYTNGILIVKNKKTRAIYLQKRTQYPYRDKNDKVRVNVPFDVGELDAYRKELGL